MSYIIILVAICLIYGILSKKNQKTAIPVVKIEKVDNSVDDAWKTLLFDPKNANRAFAEGDLSFFGNYDRALATTLQKLKTDFVDSVANIDQNGKFLGFKPNACEKDIQTITKLINNALAKAQACKDTSDEIKKDMVNFGNDSKDYAQFLKEMDRALDDDQYMQASIDDNFAKMHTYFKSKHGKEYVNEIKEMRQTDSYRRYIEEGDNLAKESFLKENCPYLVS